MKCISTQGSGSHLQPTLGDCSKAQTLAIPSRIKVRNSTGMEKMWTCLSVASLATCVVQLGFIIPNSQIEVEIEF